MSDPRVPVTLLTGFLGAGKSTVLNSILRHPDAGRIAVVVNEFGEVGIDNDLIEATGEEVILLSSGCICCSIRGDLAETLSGLIARRAAGELAFERLVIETTGLADPAPIQQTLLVDGDLARVCYLDGVVTVADAVNGAATLDAQFEAVSQAATADLILLSKTDLVGQAEVAAFRARLEGLNPTARIIDTAAVAQDPTTIWGQSGLRRDVSAGEAMAWMTREQAPLATPGPSGPLAGFGAVAQEAADPLANLSGFAATEAALAKAFSPHDGRIESASITLDAPLTDAVFDHWLDTLVALKGKDLLRVKGIVFLEGMGKPFVFHGVQHIFDPPVPLENWPEGDTTSRIVVIARDMTREQLQRSLDTLRAVKVENPKPALFAGWQEREAENWT